MRSRRLRRIAALLAVAALTIPPFPISPATADLGGSVGTIPHFTNVTGYTGTGAIATALSDLEFIRERNAAFINGGKGAAWFDYNNDGWEDLLVGGFQRRELYRNNGDGSFTETIANTGLGGTLYTMGVITPDLTNDGLPDVVFVNWFNRSEVFLNNGDGTFYNATRAWNWFFYGPSTGAAFGDLDGDGWGDLYIGSYYKRYCALLKNLQGNGFMEMGEIAGTRNLTEMTFQPLLFDFDLDGDLDIYEANDFGPDAMYRNDGNWVFTDVSTAVGLGTQGDGMGAAIGDVNDDGYMDIFVTNFAHDYWLVWNTTDAMYRDQHIAMNISDPEVGWGVQTMDFNNDGHLDVFVADGVVIAGQPAEADKLYINNGDNTFMEVSGEAGVKDWGTNRGSAAADYNKDGALDLWVSNVVANSSMYRADAPFNHWLQIEVEGVLSVRQGVGAKIAVEAGGRTQYRHVHLGSSYLSQDSLVQHIGLGGTTTVDRITIDWPSGAHQEFTDIAADQRIHIVEDEDVLPTARPADLVGDAGVPMQLDGRNSTDNTRIVDWNWSFAAPLSGLYLAGPRPWITLYQPLNYSGNLTVTDGFGNRHTAPFSVFIRPAGHPLVDAGPDIRVQANQLVNLTGTLRGPAVPPDYPNVTFSWTIQGAGGPWFYASRNVTTSFAVPGTYLATVNATDASFQSGYDAVEITVGDPEPPSIVFIPPNSVPEDTPFVLDASASTDNDPSFNTTGSFYWRVEGALGQFTTATGPAPEFTLADPGVARFELEVIDAANNTATLVFYITAVDGTPPTAEGGSDRVVSTGSSVFLDASSSNDNVGRDELLARGTFEWTFEGPDGASRAYGPSTFVELTNPGVTRVQLNVRDPSGNAAVPADTFNITALDRMAPSVLSLPELNITLGDPATFDAGAPTDNDPEFEATANYTWTFRDGAARRTLWGRVVEYTFLTPGDWVVELAVRDQAGNSKSVDFTANVTDRTAPVCLVSVVESSVVGEPVVFDATSCTDNVRIAALAWTFKPESEVRQLDSQYVRWTFKTAANYTITLTVYDNEGNYATMVFQLEVKAQPTEPVGETPQTPETPTPVPPAESVELTVLGWALIGASALGVILLVHRLRRRQA